MNIRRMVLGIILIAAALGGLAATALPQPLYTGPGTVGRMAVWQVASLSWRPWTLLGYGAVAQLYEGPGDVARLAYWNGTAWQEWNGTVPIGWLTGAAWKTYYTDAAGLFQPVALPAAYYYYQGNGVAAAPSWVNVLRPARITTTAGKDTLNKVSVLDSLFMTTLKPILYGLVPVKDTTITAERMLRIVRLAVDTLTFPSGGGYIIGDAGFGNTLQFSGIFAYGQVYSGTSVTTTGPVTGNYFTGDSVFGYTNSQWTVPNFGLALAQAGNTDTTKIWSGDSMYVGTVYLNVKTAGTVAGGDTFWVVNKAKTDSSARCFVPFGTTFAAYTINKAFPKDTLCCVVKMGGTTLPMRNYIINFNYGLRKQRAW